MTPQFLHRNTDVPRGNSQSNVISTPRMVDQQDSIQPFYIREFGVNNLRNISARNHIAAEVRVYNMRLIFTQIPSKV